MVGNVLKDIYLKLDEDQNDFERDENGVNWLDLNFNGGKKTFFRRTSVYGGATVTVSVLEQLGIEAEAINSASMRKDAGEKKQDTSEACRYILSTNDGVSYLVPSERALTSWSEPTDEPEWILVDRSANVAERLVGAIWKYKQEHPKTKLAVYLTRELSPAQQRLAGFADLWFVEADKNQFLKTTYATKLKNNSVQVCYLDAQKLNFEGAEEIWNVRKVDAITHLTIYSVITATILAIILNGGTAEEALLWAKLNIESCTLDRLPSRQKLQELVDAEREKRRTVRILAQELMELPKGILAIDESPEKINRRLEKYQIPATAMARKDFYELLLTTPNVEKYLSGVILSEDNAKMRLSNGRTLLEQAILKGIIPGVKADRGVRRNESDQEFYTTGVEKLTERLHAYYNRGFRFAKWRAVFDTTKGRPGYFALEQNTEMMAYFARQAQLAGLVPVIEPELIIGTKTTLPDVVRAEARVLRYVVKSLNVHGVDLGGCIVKCNLLTDGEQAEPKATSDDIGFVTAKVLDYLLPEMLAGVWILSGGREEIDIKSDLSAFKKQGDLPWKVSFAFSRALEIPTLKAWSKEPDLAIKTRKAQNTLLEKLKLYCEILKSS